MKPYVVIETGGKQYRVEQNAIVQVERLPVDAGSQVDLDRVLAASDGTLLEVGSPYLVGRAVRAVVMEHLRGRKVVSFKYKKRKGYRRKQGHRQELTKLKIQALDAEAAGEPDANAQREADAPEPIPVETKDVGETASEAMETAQDIKAADESAPVEVAPEEAVQQEPIAAEQAASPDEDRPSETQS
jgi:large subunit ribosomal protein L21